MKVPKIINILRECWFPLNIEEFSLNLRNIPTFYRVLSYFLMWFPDKKDCFRSFSLFPCLVVLVFIDLDLFLDVFSLSDLSSSSSIFLIPNELGLRSARNVWCRSARSDSEKLHKNYAAPHSRCKGCQFTTLHTVGILL